MKHEGIEPERKLADVTRARIGIEDLVELLGIVARRFHHFSIFELESDAVETGPLINGRRVEQDMALDGVFHRATENFAVRNVAVAAADY